MLLDIRPGIINTLQRRHGTILGTVGDTICARRPTLIQRAAKCAPCRPSVLRGYSCRAETAAAGIRVGRLNVHVEQGRGGGARSQGEEPGRGGRGRQAWETLELCRSARSETSAVDQLGLLHDYSALLVLLAAEGVTPCEKGDECVSRHEGPLPQPSIRVVTTRLGRVGPRASIPVSPHPGRRTPPPTSPRGRWRRTLARRPQHTSTRALLSSGCRRCRPQCVAPS